jgi:putative protease
MGNTHLSLSPEDIDLSLDEGINLPPSAINALRRDAAEKFVSQRREIINQEYTPPKNGFKNIKKFTTAQFFDEKSYLDAIKCNENAISSIDISFLPVDSSEKALSLSRGVYLPPVIFDGELDEVKELLEKAKKSGIMYALVSNIGQIELAKAYGLTPVGDFRLNITNVESRIAYEKMGASHLILSPELTLPKARDIGGALITYGRIPLMITERCFISENFGCKSCNNATLTDRLGEKFPMRREFRHRNVIFNSIPTYMGDRVGELKSHRIESNHLIFSNESGREIIGVLEAIKNSAPLPNKVRRVGRR